MAFQIRKEIIEEPMRIYTYLIILLAFAIQLNAKLEPLPYQKYSSYEGRHFYVGFMQNEIDNRGGITLRLFISTRAETKVVLTIPYMQPQTYYLDRNEIIEVDIPFDLELRDVSERVLRNKLVEIYSENPITVFAFNSQHTTSDAFALIPVTRWGTDYAVMSIANDQYDDPLRDEASVNDSLNRYTPRRSQYAIMAAFDSTVVTYVNRAPTRLGKVAMVEYTEILDAGEVFVVQSADAPRGENDLTASTISSNKPIGVLSGHMRSAVPLDLEYPFESKDHLIEMLPPIDSWGNQFITVPFLISNIGDFYRVISNTNSTMLEVNYPNSGRKEEFILNKGEVLDFKNIDEPAIWTSSEPILIGKYMSHSGAENDTPNFDPALVLVPPIEQFVSKILFLTPRNFRIAEQYDAHAIQIISDAQALSSLRLDEEFVKNISSIESNLIPGTNYYWTNITLSYGKHELTSIAGRFAGIMFGYGFRDSYAMAMGSAMTDMDKNDTIPPNVEITEDCGRVHGIITDIGGDNTGIDYVWVDPERTNNYTIEFNPSPIPDTATYVEFTAIPNNFKYDGKIYMEIYDKNSNGVRYTHYYDGINVETIEELIFGEVDWNQSETLSFTFDNNSNAPVLIEDIKVLNDARVTVEHGLTLPDSIDKRSSLDIDVTFTPAKDSTELKAILAIEIECGYVLYVNLSGTVLAPYLLTKGYDFGEVLVGETVCDTIWIYNPGNIPLTINEQNIDELAPQFEYIIDGILPANISPLDSLGIEVCFTPDDTLQYESVTSYENNENLANSIAVLGVGVAPNIHSIEYDWGEKRVGTTNDIQLKLHNTGKYDGTISFTSVLSDNTDNGVFQGQDLVDGLIPEVDSVAFDFTYIPNNTNSHEKITDYNIDWAPHPQVTITLKGTGTLPEIETFSHQVDTTLFSLTEDTVLTLVLSGGNEDLTIDEIFIKSGDIASFDIPFNNYQNITIKPDSALEIPVSFSPMEIGLHEIFLGVRHDANPNFERSEEEIRIWGICIPKDTIGIKQKLISPEIVTSCVEDFATIMIADTGNTAITLTDIELITNPIDFDASFTEDVQSLLPIELLPGDEITFDIRFYARRNENATININTVYDDTTHKTETFEVIPQASKLVFNQFDSFDISPGDTVNITIAGSFPHAVNPEVEFDLKINVDRFGFVLYENNAELIVNNNNGEARYPATLSQEGDWITIDLNDRKLEIDENTTWSLTFPMRALLTSHQNIIFEIYANSDLCFEPNIAEINAKIVEVCIFDLRPVEFIANLPKLNISPNPAGNNVRLSVMVPEDCMAEIKIYDESGKQMPFSKNLSLKKGTQTVILENVGLPNGVYYLNLITNKYLENQMFIILK